SIDDLGRAVGTSGPALYRHFPGKEALLAAMLLEVSERLAADGRRRAETCADDPRRALEELLRGHIRFALTEPALITVHDRELDNVPEPHRRRIRRLQRGYVEQWVGVLARLRPDAAPPTLRAAVHAVFGLLNSTPHSAQELALEPMAELLAAMGRAALLAGD
ncbi:TetR/AcrR family transcriptional regulator, partial [Streptomonospora algeriensis]